MSRFRHAMLGGVTAGLLTIGLFFTIHRSKEQSDLGTGPVFADFLVSLGDLTEIRLSKGDGSRTTLQKGAAGWMVVERGFPADAGRVRKLALGLANLRVVERKTADPANYARLGVEAPDSPTAGSTLVEAVAGAKTWKLIVGKGAEGRSVYVRKPDDKTSLMAEPFLSADPDQKRWIDRLVTDLPGAAVHDVAVRAGKGPAYLLTRAQRGSPEVALSPVPKGRAPASNMSLSAQAEALSSFHFDDVRARPATAAATDSATFRTFDGQVIEFTGRREGEKAYVTVKARRDAALAAQFAPPPPDAAAAAAASPVAAKPAEEDKAVERLEARPKDVEFEIPVYKYEAIFKPYEELLEKK